MPPHASEVVVFWDPENTGSGASVDVHGMMARLRALRPHARSARGVVCGKLCCFTQELIDTLALHNMDVIVAPTGKNAADRLLQREMERCNHEDTCAVLVSGDGGFAPHLRAFEDSILLHADGNVADVLLAAAKEHYSLEELQRSPLQHDALTAPPWIALHVAALYRCGLVGAGKTQYPFHTSCSPAAIARAYTQNHHGKSLQGKPRLFVLTHTFWLKEIVTMDGYLQLYIPTPALLSILQHEDVLQYAQQKGWNALPLHVALQTSNPHTLERAIRANLLDTQQHQQQQQQHTEDAELVDTLRQEYRRVGEPHPHPELNIHLLTNAIVRAHQERPDDPSSGWNERI